LEEENSDKKMNLDSVKSILTLRYDYTQTPNLPNLSWNDISNPTQLNSEKIEQLILDEISKNIPTSYDGKITVPLSGGIDSTLMMCLLRKKFPDNEIHAISVKFQNSHDETKNAAKIAQKFNAVHHIVEIKNYLEKLPLAISITKSPFWDIHWLYVVEEAQKFSNFLVSGDGGDELFGGYIFRYSKFLSLIKPNSTTKEKISAYLSCHERDHVPDQEKLFTEKCHFSWESFHDILKPFFDNSLEPLQQVFLADYNGKLLYNFSLVNDHLASYYKIKSIAPLLSRNLINESMCLQNPEKYNVESNLGKLPLVKILKKYDLLNLVSQEKLGFSVNTVSLWKNYGYDIFKKYVLNGEIILDGWISKDWIEKHFKKDMDIRYVNKFLGLISLEIWYRMFIKKTITSDFNF